jgi:iron complex outermembrane receptor protein
MNKMKPLASALVLAIYGTGAFAQTGVLEEVIVTATKRAESLQDIPVAVNAFNSETTPSTSTLTRARSMPA